MFKISIRVPVFAIGAEVAVGGLSFACGEPFSARENLREESNAELTVDGGSRLDSSGASAIDATPWAADALVPSDAGTVSQCTQVTCQQAGRECGSFEQCDQVTQCGLATSDGCSVGKFCNGGKCTTTPCVAKTCGELSLVCGKATNNCGASIECGSCATGQECRASGKTCCANDKCNAYSYTCGVFKNGCGELLTCGPSPSTDSGRDKHCPTTLPKYYACGKSAGNGNGNGNNGNGNGNSGNDEGLGASNPFSDRLCQPSDKNLKGAVGWCCER